MHEPWAAEHLLLFFTVLWSCHSLGKVHYSKTGKHCSACWASVMTSFLKASFDSGLLARQRCWQWLDWIISCGWRSVTEKMKSSVTKVHKSVQGMFVIAIWACSFRKDSAVFFLHAGWDHLLLGKWTKVKLTLSSLFQWVYNGHEAHRGHTVTWRHSGRVHR